MANLPENTTYNKPGTQSPLANFSNISKLLQENTQKESSDIFKSSLMSHYNPDSFSKIFGSVNKPISNTSFGAPINTPVTGELTDLPKNQPLPEDYTQIVPPDEKGNWVEPSDSAKLRNWPSYLGGGQYITDPTQSDKLIKSGRAIVNEDINPGAKQKLLGNLSPSLYQVDHIIPLWAGGADTLQNLQILDLPTHEKKTAVQSVALTLLANNKINLEEARRLAFTWKDKDVEGLPSIDTINNLGGYVPLSNAEKIVKKWEEDLQPHPSKFFGEAFREKMADFGRGWLPTPIREFAKGLVGGGTAGIVPATGPSEDSGTLGTIGNIAGNIVGTISGLGLLSKGVSATIRGTKALLGIKKAVNIADDAMKATGLITDIGDLTAKTINAKKRAETLTKMASTAGLLSLWGQIGLTGREATGQLQTEFKNHVNQFFSDVAFGSLLGSAGQNIKGYARVGLGTASLSLMEGDTIQDALQNAGLMTALHGMAYSKGMLDPKTRIGNEEAYKMSASAINKYLGDVVPTIKKGQTVPSVLKLDIPKLDNMRVEYQKKYPNDQRFKNLGTITNNEEAIHFIEKASRRQLGNLIAKSDGGISQDEIKKEMTRIITAKNQLYNQTLPPDVRPKKEWEDLVSLGAKLKPSLTTEKTRMAVNANDNLKKIPLNIPDVKYENINNIDFPVGKGGITGYGAKLDPQAKANIDDFAKNPNKYDGKIYIPKTDAETAAIQRGVNLDYLANGKPPPTEIPEHTLRVFVRTIEGEFKPIGYIPQEASFNTKKYDLNMTYREQINRFRHIIKTAKDAEQLKFFFNDDKAIINIDKKTADFIFEKKNLLTDEELYNLLKPNDVYYKLDSNLNNSALFNKMEELGIDNLVVDPLKAWEINGIRPRYNPENPYINLDISEQDWLRSIAIKEGKIKTEAPKPATNLNKTIEKIVNQQKAEGVPKTTPKTPIVRAIAKQSTLPLESTPSVPILAPKSPVEAPKTQEMSNTSSEVKTTPKLDINKKDISISRGKNPDLTDQFFSRIVHDIEYRKVKPDSPESLQKTYKNIVDSFKATNPGVSEVEFRNAVKDAKSRAEVYIQDLVDDMYKGTKRFGTEEIYKRDQNTQVNPEYWKAIQSGLEESQIKDLGIKKTIPKIEKTPYESRDVKLAKEFGLKLQEPNQSGFQYLELDRKGNPVFSQEYLKKHPNTKGTPLDVWGSFLENELKANKKELSLQSETWKKQIDKMKSSKNPYSKGVAEALDKSLSEKYSIKNPKTGEIKHDWHESWKLNSGLKKIRELFVSKNEEGKLLSKPYRRTMAEGGKKNYGDIVKEVAKADKKTRLLTEKARIDRENLMNNNKKPVLPEGMSVKDLNQVQDVSNDLTPYDLLHTGLIRQEVRSDLISRYNNILPEMKEGRRIETRIGPDGEKILGTRDEMARLFNGIKELSQYIPESKDWKLGKKIKLKNNGEPTFEEGITDGIKIAAKIFKLNSSPGFVNFENIRKALLKDNPNLKGSVPINVLLKTGLGALGLTGLSSLANIGNTSYYTSPNKEFDIYKDNLSNNKIKNLLLHLESSNGKNKSSADEGEVKWLTGLTDSAIKELKRTGIKDSVKINDRNDVLDASVKYFKLMKERHPDLSNAEVYVDYYWGGAKNEEKRQKRIKEVEKLLKNL